MSAVSLSLGQSQSVRFPRYAHKKRNNRHGCWHGHDVEEGFLPLAPRGLASRFSSQGSACQGLINDGSSAYRTWLSFPNDRWMASSLYPDAPTTVGFQLLGFSSATHGPLGLMNLHAAKGAHDQAAKMGDTWGTRYSKGDAVISLAQSGFGFDYGIFRVANIGQVVATSQGNTAAAAQWGDLSQKTGLGGNIFGAILYGGLSLSEGLKGLQSAHLKFKLWKMGSDEERMDYLCKLYRADEEVLLQKEEKRLKRKNPDFVDEAERIRELARENLGEKARNAALDEQTGVLQSSIEFMKKHKMCGQGFAPTPAELQKIVKERLNDQALEAHGKKLLVGRLKAKKISQLTRLIGANGVKELAKEDRGKIVLANIEASHSSTRWGNAGRFLLYAAGAIGMALLCVFTAGTPLILLTLLCAAVFTIEVVLSYQRMQALKKDVSSPPGDYDKAWPAASLVLCAVALTTAIIVASVFSLGIVPLVLSIVGATMWASMNIYQLGCIDERRQKYIERLMEQGEIKAVEFSYIAANGTPEQTKAALDKLPWKDQIEIKKALQEEGEHETLVDEQRRYHQAAEAHMLEQQKLSLQALNLDQHFEWERWHSK